MRQYIRAIDKQFGYLGNWLPTTPVAVGDIGVWTDDGFSKVKGLRNVGPSFKEVAGELKGDLSHRSVYKAEMSPSASGHGVEAAFTFKAEGEFVFQATGCTSKVIDTNLTALEGYCRDGFWNHDWILITEVVYAERATVLLSCSQGGSVKIAGPASLDDLVKAGLSISASSGKVTEFLAQSGIIPMFKAIQVSRRFLRGLRIEPAKRGIEDGDFGFEPVTCADLLGDG